jgi:hypothetical protein
VPDILRPSLDNRNIALSGLEFEMKHGPSPVQVGELKRATNSGLEFNVNWKKTLVPGVRHLLEAVKANYPLHLLYPPFQVRGNNHSTID